MRDLTALITAGSLLVSTLTLVQLSPAQQQPAAGPSLVLNLPSASLAEVIDILARQLKMNYILDPRVKGSITVHTYGEVKATEVRGLLDTILRVNGYSLIQVGDLWRIVPAAEANRLPVKPRIAGANEVPDDESLVLNLVFLKFASAAEISKLIEQFLGEGSKLVIYEPANLMLILDNGRNMRRTLELVNMFDSETIAGQRIRLFETKNSRPSELARELDRVMGTLGLAQKNAAIQFLPIDRINVLVAFAPNPGAFSEVEKWVDRLDVEAKPPVGGTDNYVFRVKYGRAESLSMAVTLLYLSQQLSPTDTFAYLYLMNMMNQLAYTQTANAGAVPGQGVGAGGVNPFPGGYGGAYGGGGMAGGFGGLMPLFGGGMAMGGMMGMGGMGMGGMGMGAPQQPVAGGIPATRTDQTGQFLQGGGAGGGVTASPLKIPRVIPNPFDNTLLIQATAQEYQQIVKLLEKIDVPPRQILIDAKIYEVTLTDALSSGVQAFLQAKGTAPARQFLGSFTGDAGLSLSAGWLVSQSRELLFFLQAQEDIRKTKVIAAPSVLATDNIPASINVGTEVPILIGTAVAPGVSQGGTNPLFNTVSNRNAGVTLTITSRVQPSGIVTMVINQEVSQAIAPSASSAIQSPSFSRRNVQTQVTVQDGDTIAIGGIIQENDLNSTVGVPGLARVPILGSLFGSKSITKTRTELVIFLTPRVVYDTPEVTEATEELKARFKSLTRIMRR
jgi:general secretion pathway protein D